MFFWRELDRYRSPGNYGYSSYVTRDLVRRELVAEQGLLRPLPLEDDPDSSEVYEVVGWENWRSNDKTQPVAGQSASHRHRVGGHAQLQSRTLSIPVATTDPASVGA